MEKNECKIWVYVNVLFIFFKIIYSIVNRNECRLRMMKYFVYIYLDK